MAIGFFGLALFLFLGLDFDEGSPSPAYAASSDGVEVVMISPLIVDCSRFLVCGDLLA
ncbi:hypothetical protein BT93_L2869 [Corymbia citriodora subsp. variegata]|uniref:Secreted protein n=1 Tax=Corymbia citriodora subsp. variegata TaxID=360336 RepID=A0A8T0CIE0_CORYI|nr:hypothetical protein BT93_L2869 [Corymbia citriodora subsp. variegata]